MSAQLRKKSGRGAAAEPPAYAEELPSPSKPLSLYRSRKEASLGLGVTLLLSAAPMSGSVRARRGCGVTADLLKHAAELPSSSKLLSNYRRPAGTKTMRSEKAKHAARARWSQPDVMAATAAAAAAGDDRTVRWGGLCTLGAMASAGFGVAHLLAVGVLKAVPGAGSRKLRAVAAAVFAAELGGPEHGRLGAAALSKLAHGFARCVALRAAHPHTSPSALGAAPPA